MNGEAVAWLREQIAHRLEVARLATAGPWRAIDAAIWGQPGPCAPGAGEVLVVKRTWLQESAHIVLNDPQDVTARCEAELVILDRCAPPVMTGVARDVVRAVASGYRHRPGYAEHWGKGE